MAWVAKKKRTRWILQGKVVPAKTPGAEKETRKSSFYYGFWYTGGKLCQKEFKGCTDKRAAQTLLHEHLSSLSQQDSSEQTIVSSTSSLSLASYLEEYLAQVRETRKLKTFSHASSYLHKWIDEVGEEVTIKTLRWNEGLKAVVGSGRYKHACNVASMINSFLRFVCERESLRQPPEGFFAPEPDKSYQAARHGTLTAEELTALLISVKKYSDEQNHPVVRRSSWERWLIYRMMTLTLTRFKTLTEIKVSQLGLRGDSPVLHLAQTQTKSNRAVSKPLPPSLARDLQEFIDERGLSYDDNVFTLDYDHFYRTWKTDLSRCGLRLTDPAGRILGPHSLKATGITLLIDQGLDVATVSELAEHTDVRLTLAVYKDSLLRKKPLLQKHLNLLEDSLNDSSQRKKKQEEEPL